MTSKESLRSELRSKNGKVEIDTAFLKEFSFSKGLWAVYNPLADEPDLSFSEEQDLCFPKSLPATNEMIFFSNRNFEKSSLGVAEPKLDMSTKVEKEKIKLIFVPGLAFDFYGGRLGRGKGYYDRFLKDFIGTKIGTCSSERFLNERVPTEQHDISMDYILTERFLFKVNTQKEVQHEH